jgi:4-hydroxymandelate synthase
MATSHAQVFENVSVDHVEFYVGDATAQADWLAEGYGFQAEELTGASGEARSIALGRNRIRLVVTQPMTGDHPAAAYIEKHGDGVADIALRVVDAAAAFEEAVRRGARPVSPPAARDGRVFATIMGFGDVVHTFVQALEAPERRAPHESGAPAEAASDGRLGLQEVDHFAVCLEAGLLDPTVEFYEKVLDFEMIFTERIVVGSQAMNSKVVQSRSGGVTLTLIEPDVSQTSGQIDEFLKNHGGAGVQHIAFTADDIVRAVDSIGSAGVRFLKTPAAYYRLLSDRLTPTRYSVGELERLNILVDEDHDGQLFQIFAKSVHPRNTFFLEVIERMGARTFGSNNIKALYEAVELQRIKDAAAG